MKGFGFGDGGEWRGEGFAVVAVDSGSCGVVSLVCWWIEEMFIRRSHSFSRLGDVLVD